MCASTSLLVIRREFHYFITLLIYLPSDLHVAIAIFDLQINF